MKTWQVHYTVKLGNGSVRRDYQFSVTQRFEPTQEAAKSAARDHVEPILHRRINLRDIDVNWIRHTRLIPRY